MSKVLTVLALALVVAANAFAADNLRLNQGLDYSSDSMDGPLITGDHFDAGAQAAGPTTSSFMERVVSIPSGKRSERSSSTKSIRTQSPLSSSTWTCRDPKHSRNW